MKIWIWDVDVISMIVLFVMLAIGVFLGSMIVKYKSIDKDDLNSFKKGYHDSYIDVIDDFIIKCIPANVEVFELQNYNGKKDGILYRCIGDVNWTLPIKYSDMKK